MLADFAGALGVGIEQLLGLKAIEKKVSPRKARLLKRLEKVAEPPPPDERAMLKMVDALAANRGLGD